MILTSPRVAVRHLLCLVMLLAAWTASMVQPANAQGMSLGADNGDSIAIVIGNKNYRQTVAVDFAHNDADAMSEYLVKGLGFRQGNVTVLKDATFSELTQVFGSERNPQGRLFNRVTEGKSNVFVFFSGHGVPDLRSRQPFLLPSDGDPNQGESGYMLETLYRNLELVKQKIGANRQLIVMVDACFTGETGRKGETLLAVSAPGFAPARPKAGNGIIRLAATSGATPANWDEQLKLSLLTSRFLTGVAGLASKNGQSPLVSWDELSAYVKDEVSQAARRATGREQLPEIDASPISLTVAPVPAVAEAIAAARDDILWREAERAGTREAFERYIARCGTVCANRQAALGKLMQQQQGQQSVYDEENWKRLSAGQKYEEYLRSCQPVCAFRQLAEGYLAASNPDFDPRVRRCDDLAAGPFDADKPKHVAGLAMAKMDARAAVAACTDAVKAQPRLRRVHYQLGRAHDALDEYPKALAAYRAAVDMKSPAAMNNLGTLFENGTGVGASLPDAVKWYRAGADAGDRLAMSNLARMAEYGRGMPRNMGEAAKWYRQAAEAGDLFSNTKFANLMMDNAAIPGVQREPMAAMLRLQKSIEGGEPMAMVTMALMIDRGFDVKAFTSRTTMDLLTSALKAGETGARTVAVAEVFNQLKPETRTSLQRSIQQTGAYGGPIDGRMSPAFTQALIAHAKALETRQETRQ